MSQKRKSGVTTANTSVLIYLVSLELQAFHQISTCKFLLKSQLGICKFTVILSICKYPGISFLYQYINVNVKKEREREKKKKKEEYSLAAIADVFATTCNKIKNKNKKVCLYQISK